MTTLSPVAATEPTDSTRRTLARLVWPIYAPMLLAAVGSSALLPIIPLMAYNVFTAMDETYWTGYPTAENPYANPVPNWGNSRSMMVRLKPKQQ